MERFCGEVVIGQNEDTVCAPFADQLNEDFMRCLAKHPLKSCVTANPGDPKPLDH